MKQHLCRILGLSVVAIALALAGCGGGGGSSSSPSSGGSAGSGGGSGASGGGATALEVDHQPGYDFGVVATGSESSPVALTVRNAGSSSSGPLAAASLSGSGAAEFTIADDGCIGKTLAASASCTVSVAMSPHAVGMPSATFTISATPGGSASAQLSGTAVAPGALRITPSPADFGSQPIVSGQKALTLTVKNSGDSATGAVTLRLSGSDAAQYSITGGSCMGSIVLGAGESCTSVVSFHPTQAGTLSATLVADATPGGPGIANLTGVGLGDASLQFTIGPTPFGVVDATAPKTETLTLTNTGGQPSGDLTFQTTGDAAFHVVPGGTCVSGMPLAAGDSCTLVVQFAPTAIGALTGSLVASATPGGMASVDLSGTGQKDVTLTIDATGNGTGSVSVDGVDCASFPCVMSFKVSDPNRAATLIATPGAASNFVGWNYDCGGSGQCRPLLNQDRQVQASFTLKQYAVQITLKNVRGATGSVSATAVPAGPALTCSGNVCTGQYTAGAVITLQAVAGAQALFQSWGAECPSRFDSHCVTPALAGSFATTITFRPAINYMFVTSGTLPVVTLGPDLDAADAFCDDAARAAWLVNTPTSKPRYFKALVSTTQLDARARIDGARGFILPNGKEFADLPQNLFDETGATVPFQMFYPPSITETGSRLPRPATVVTGAASNGTTYRDNQQLAYTCHDWGGTATTSAGGSFDGTPTNGAGTWLSARFDNAACNLDTHVYCVETAQPSTPVTVLKPASSRIAFVSVGKIAGSAGRDAADALCAAEAQQQSFSGVYLALLSGANEAPSARFDLSGPPWVRPDGVLLADTATAFLTQPFNWLATLNQRSDGSYILFTAPIPYAWIGATTPSSLPSVNSPNCDNWSSPTAKGSASLAAFEIEDNVDTGGSINCDTQQSVFCLQQ